MMIGHWNIGLFGLSFIVSILCFPGSGATAMKLSIIPVKPIRQSAPLGFVITKKNSADRLWRLLCLYHKGMQQHHRDIQEEYDLVTTNGEAVGIIEIKYEAHQNGLDKLKRKMRHFKKLFSIYNAYKLYGAIASFHINTMPSAKFWIVFFLFSKVAAKWCIRIVSRI